MGRLISISLALALLSRAPSAMGQTGSLSPAFADDDSSVVQAGAFACRQCGARPGCCRCPCMPRVYGPCQAMPRAPAAPAKPEPSPSETSPEAPTQPQAEPERPNVFDEAQNARPNSNQLASSMAAARGAQSDAPFMIGDAFGSGGTTTTVLGPVIDHAIITSLASDPNHSSVLASYSGAPGNYFLNGAFYTYDSGTQHVQTFPTTGPVSTTLVPLPNANSAVYSGLTHAVAFTGSNNMVAVANQPGVFTATQNGQTVIVPAYFPGQSNGTAVYNIQEQFSVNVPPPAAVTGLVKISENTSPMPRDRIFFNYSLFQNVPFTPTISNVNRYTPGFEKTFFDRWASFEMRFPFATSIDSSNVLVNGITNTATQFGDMSAVAKVLLIRNRNFALSTGMQVVMPTAQGTNAYFADGTPVARVTNASVHLAPFFGALYTPNDRLFAQGFLQCDVDANGNPVYINDMQTGLVRAGTVNSQTLMFVDLGAGYWILRRNYGGLTGIAPTIEVHNNTAVSNPAGTTLGNVTVQNSAIGYQQVNMVFGSTFQFGPMSTLTVGYTAPFHCNGVRPYDGELRVFVNRRFGPQNRLTRAQF